MIDTYVDIIVTTIAARLDIIRRKKKKVKKNITFVNIVKTKEKMESTHEVHVFLATATD